jgi:N6-adenosine-specific RNA methylase IME4
MLVDPPWRFKNWSSEGVPQRAPAPHYPTMSKRQLKALPIGDLAARNAVLFMWVLDTHLDVALELGRHWGFAYKTVAFTWVKTTLTDPDRTIMGMGRWTRKEAEQCLLFTRGRPRRLQGGGGVRQVIFAPRREHSRKPDEQYRRIEQLVAGPYVELFAQQRWPGWESWGRDVDKFEVAA